MNPSPLPPAAPVSPSDADPSSGIRARSSVPPDVEAFLREQIRNPHRFKLRVRRPDAEDLIQRTCELFLQHHDKIRPGAREAWFRTTLRHRELALRRKEGCWRKYEPLLDAHLSEHGPSVDAPDAELRRQAVAEALLWLLQQVKPSRREVAARCLEDPRDLHLIAAELGVPVGTVASRWDRAKKDMRAALARERRKLDAWLLAALSAIVGGLLVWLASHARRAASALPAAVAAPSRRSGPYAAGAGILRRGLDDQGAPRHALAVRTAALACAALSLTVRSHAELDGAPEDHARAGEMVAVSFGVAAGATAADASPPAPPVEGVEPAGPGSSAGATAEPERDGRSPVAAPVAAPPSRGSPPRSNPASAREAPSKMPRILLLRATAALAEGQVAVARDALRRYRRAYPKNPYPAQYEQLARAIRSLDGASGPAVP